MSKRTITPTRIPDRLSYLWLALTAALYLFTGGLWVIPLAAWLAPSARFLSLVSRCRLAGCRRFPWR